MNFLSFIQLIHLLIALNQLHIFITIVCYNVNLWLGCMFAYFNHFNFLCSYSCSPSSWWCPLQEIPNHHHWHSWNFYCLLHVHSLKIPNSCNVVIRCSSSSICSYPTTTKNQWKFINCVFKGPNVKPLFFH